jgi:hypothetical protein
MIHKVIANKIIDVLIIIINLANLIMYIFIFFYKEFKNAVKNYLDELKSLHPNIASKSITIHSTTHENCFKDFCEAIKNFDKVDFIYRPFIRIQQE